jgi:hypothetical protein
MRIFALVLITVLAMANSAMAQYTIDQFKASGVSIRNSNYKGDAAVEITMPSSSYQDPSREKLADRNFMAWLPMDFGDGTIEVELASDLAPDAPDYARGFIGLAFRIDDQGRFENIYLRPLNSTSSDQIRRNHTIQYASYPDFRFDALRAQFPEKYETYADIEMGRWIHLRIIVKGLSTKLYLNHSNRPAFIVNDMKLPASQRGGVGIWIESGTIGHFRNLRIVSDN